MKKKLSILVLVAAALLCTAAPVDYRKVQFQRRFLASAWKNIKHINADTTRFGSLGERITAGTRGDIKSTRDDDFPDPKVLREKVALLKKMLRRKDLAPADRDEALYYLGASALYLDDHKGAKRYCRKLEKVNRKSPWLKQLRAEIARYEKAE